MSSVAANEAVLLELLDRYFTALAGGDPARLPLAPRVRFTENGQELALGRGLWATVSHVAPKRCVAVADSARGAVAGWGVVHEAGVPAIAMVRLRATGDCIDEVETLVCRQLGHDKDGFILDLDGLSERRTVFDEPVEPADRHSADELIACMHAYLDAIVASDSSLVSVRDDCIRIENGVQTVLNPRGRGLPAETRDSPYWGMSVSEQIDSGVFRDIETARDRRCLAVDEHRGVLFVLFAFDHPGPLVRAAHESRFARPNTMVVAEVFKVRGGTIRQIEAVLDVFPYGMELGWPRSREVDGSDDRW